MIVSLAFLLLAISSEDSQNTIRELQTDVQRCNEERLEDKSKYHYEIETIRMQKSKCTDKLDHGLEKQRRLFYNIEKKIEFLFCSVGSPCGEYCQ